MLQFNSILFVKRYCARNFCGIFFFIIVAANYHFTQWNALLGILFRTENLQKKIVIPRDAKLCSVYFMRNVCNIEAPLRCTLPWAGWAQRLKRGRGLGRYAGRPWGSSSPCSSPPPPGSSFLISVSKWSTFTSKWWLRDGWSPCREACRDTQTSIGLLAVAI